MIEVQLLTSHFNNDLDDDVLITISDTDYSNDWIFLWWLKHFDRFSQKHQKKAWRMLVMNDYEFVMKVVWSELCMSEDMTFSI